MKTASQTMGTSSLRDSPGDPELVTRIHPRGAENGERHFTPPLRGGATVPASRPRPRRYFVRFVTRLLATACLAACVLVPAAAGADRMWVGFHDDPELRFDASRTNAM